MLQVVPTSRFSQLLHFESGPDRVSDREQLTE